MAEPPTEESTAKARVFATIELFDLILSNLGFRDLFTVAAVCRGFRAVVRTSPAAQALFLHKRPILPGKWFVLRRERGPHIDDRQTPAPPVYTIEPRSFASVFVGTKGHTSQDTKHLTELCHWLVGFHSTFRASDFKMIMELLWRDYSRLAAPIHHARFPADPGEDSLFAAMLLTSPPCHDASIRLSYVHDEDQTSLCATRSVHDSHALTVGSLLRAASQMRGQVALTRIIGDIEYEHELEDTSLETELTNQKFRGGRFSMDLQKTQIQFRNRDVIITPEAWKELQRKQMMSDFEDGLLPDVDEEQT